MAVDIGKIVEGKVVSVMGFGAFVELPDKTNGLVHISEIAVEYVKDINQHIKNGDIVKVKIVGVDEKGKISLSIKKALLEEKKITGTDAPRNNRAPAHSNFGFRNNKVDPANMSFEDKMNRFKMDSDEKMHTLKRSFESKRGSSYKR